MNDAGVETSFSYLNLLPKITQQPESVSNQPIRETAIFTCEAEGYPEPSYKWQRRQGSSFNDIPDENSSTVDIMVAHSAAGGYRCVASNTINGTLREAESDVAILHGIFTLHISKLIYSSLFCSYTVSPGGSLIMTGEVNGTTYSTNIPVKQGGEFKLTCTAEGGPSNLYTWHLNGQVVTDNSFNITSTSGDISSTSTLSVSNVDAITHAGMYRCTVSNEADSNGDSTSAQVIGILDITPSYTSYQVV